MDPIKVDFTGRHGNKKKEIVIPPEKAALKIIISLFGTLLAAGLYYYLMLPPVNFKAYEFYIYLAAVIGTYIGLTFVTTKAFAKPEYVPYVKKRSLVPGILLAALALVVGVGFIISTPFFRAKSYSKIIDVDVTGNFTEEIERQMPSLTAIFQGLTRPRRPMWHPGL